SPAAARRRGAGGARLSGDATAPPGGRPLPRRWDVGTAEEPSVGIIGRRFRVTAPVAVGIAAILALGAVMSARSPDPFVADPAAAAALRAAVASDRALAEAQLVQLRDALSAALGDGRRGAALTVQGTQRPGPPLAAAA